MKSVRLQFTSVMGFKVPWCYGWQHRSGQAKLSGFPDCSAGLEHHSQQCPKGELPAPAALLWAFLPLVTLKERDVLAFPGSKCSKERDGNLYWATLPAAVGNNISFSWSFSSFKTIITGTIVHCLPDSGRGKITSVENKSASGENTSQTEIFSPSKQLHDEQQHSWCIYTPPFPSLGTVN